MILKYIDFINEEKEEIDFYKLNFKVYHFNYGYDFTFLYKDEEIGYCEIYYNNTLSYEDTLFELGLNKRDYKKDYYYLHSIGLNKKYRGFGIGKYLLNKIMSDYNIKGIYLYALKNHHFWCEVGKKVIPTKKVISPYCVFIYKP